MYKITNIYTTDVELLLLDHANMWNDRLHHVLKPNATFDITDEQLSKEIQHLEKKKRIKLVQIEDAKEVEVLSVKDTLVKKLSKKIADKTDTVTSTTLTNEDNK
jgi:hypothetical protein